MRPPSPVLLAIPALGTLFLFRYHRLRKGMDRRARRAWRQRTALFLAASGVVLEALATLRGTLLLPFPLVVLLVCAGAFALRRCIQPETP